MLELWTQVEAFYNIGNQSVKSRLLANKSCNTPITLYVSALFPCSVTFFRSHRVDTLSGELQLAGVL